MEVLPLSKWLPSEADCARPREEYIVLTARIIVSKLPQFEQLSCAVQEAIPHQYSKEMEEKSVMVSMHCSISLALYVFTIMILKHACCS